MQLWETSMQKSRRTEKNYEWWSCFGRHREGLCKKKIIIIIYIYIYIYICIPTRCMWSRVYNQCVLPTMTYGSEILSTTKYLETEADWPLWSFGNCHMGHLVLGCSGMLTEWRKRGTKITDQIATCHSHLKLPAHLLEKQTSISPKSNGTTNAENFILKQN